MSTKSDYFFANIKQLYPSFPKPSALEVEIWEEILEPYSEEAIRRGIKSYRKTEDTPYAPTPAKFSDFLYEPKPVKPKSFEDDLPPSPVSYLIEQDAKAGRLKYFFPTYVKAVNYLLDVKIKEVMTEEEYKKSTRGQRYRLAVDNGLFANFDQTLDYVAEKEGML